MKFATLRTLVVLIGASIGLQACIPLVAAGVGTTVTASLDRRSYGTQLEDTEIEHRFNRSFPAELEARSNASATAYNRWVLITGQAQDADAKAKVENVARNVQSVRNVVNELSIGYPASFSSRANDTLLTSKVKTRLFDNVEISAHHVKVVSESGVVYLMGLLTEREAEIATEIARTTAGVQRVVRVFEIITPDEAARLTSSVQPQPVK